MSGPESTTEKAPIVGLKDGDPLINRVTQDMLTAVRESLYASIYTLLEKTDADTNPNETKKIDHAIGIAVQLPGDIPAMAQSWNLLAKELQPSGGIFSGDFRKVTTAFMIGAALIEQTGLPIEKRAAIRNLREHSGSGNASNTAANLKRGHSILLGQGVDSKPRETVVAAIQEYKDAVDEAMEVSVDGDEEATRVQIKIVDAVYAAMEKDLASTHLYKIYREYAGPQMQEWFGKYADRAVGNELAKRLLLNGELDNVHPIVRFCTLVSILARNISGEAENRPGGLSQVAQYFLNHPELYIYFWGKAWDKNYLKVGNKDYKPEAKFREEWWVMMWFLGQNENLLEGFFQTATAPDKKSEQATMIRIMLGAAGIFKKTYPDHPNNQLIITYLKNFIGRTGFAGFSEELAVLEDTVPGALYLNLYLEARAISPKQGETREVFLAEHVPGDMIYVSKAAFADKQALRQESNEKARLELETGETLQVKPWGEVQMPGEKGVIRLLDRLQVKLLKLGIKEDDLARLIDQYNRNIGSAPGQTILPDLLPSGHPIFALKALGVLAVDHKDGAVDFVIDTKKIEIETTDSRRVLLRGSLAGNNDLEIAGAPPEFTYSPLHLLFNAASLLGKTNFVPNTLSREDISYINGMLQIWKSIAKEHGISKLSHVPNLVTRDSDHNVVRLPVGKNTAYLTFS